MRATLSAREKAVLTQVDPTLAAYVEDASGSWDARLSALRKVTAMIRAEREALEEVTVLGFVKSGTENLSQLQTHMAAQRARMEQLAGENDTLRQKLGATTALPAMVTYGD